MKIYPEELRELLKEAYGQGIKDENKAQNYIKEIVELKDKNDKLKTEIETLKGIIKSLESI